MRQREKTRDATSLLTKIFQKRRPKNLTKFSLSARASSPWALSVYKGQSAMPQDGTFSHLGLAPKAPDCC